ncbi:MAG: DNA-3-methyladenine glycosylase family protein [Anaerovoracaceae bacterium]
MKYTVDHVKDFNLDHIFDCGQCFRWERQEDGSYTGTAMGKAVNMAFERGVLTIDNCTPEDYESIWRPYLDMDRDYGAIKAELSEADPTIKGACDYGYGIRILRQDFWESVVSFIISQNNNIPRIKGCIEALCAAFGERIGEYGGKEYFSIPSPEKLASLTSGDLAPIRLGYRAPYLVKAAAQFIEEEGPDAVQTRLAAAEDPIGQLQKFCGIGPKVASCISLFGLGRTDAFPIDVWMRRVMNRLYGIEEKDMRSMAAYAAEHFGKYGGIAQQYLFYYIRSL